MDMKEIEVEKKLEWKFQEKEMLLPNMRQLAIQFADI